jgi:hypothetical protein
MLIDIEKYIRQMLPPDRRLPKHVGLGTLLFSPVISVIDSWNEYKYNTQFDTGTPEQVAVLEYILQSYVNSNIRVLGADGVRIDFRVLVPESLSLSERGEVIRIVERYRLRSKRYEVANQLDWGNGGSDPVTGLTWSPLPTITPTGVGTWMISFGVDDAGVWPTIIYNSTTGNQVVNLDREYAANTLANFPVTEPGNYTITVAGLTYSVTATPTVILTAAPAWLTGIGLTVDVNSREATTYIKATVPCRLKIVSTDGTPISGANPAWSSSNYIEGDSEFAQAPWSEYFRHNPLSYGVGGLTPGKSYVVDIARDSDPYTIFRKTITIPTVSRIYPPLEIDIAVDPGLVACELGGPKPASMVLFGSYGVTWNNDSKNVSKLRGYLKNVTTNQIVREKEITVATLVNGVLTGVFTPGWRITTSWTEPVPDGTYVWGTEGVNCSSPINWSAPFAIVTDVIDPGEPLDPQSGDWQVFPQIVPFPGHMKLQRTPTPTGWLYTDLVQKSATGVDMSQNPKGWYVINGKRIETDRLVNYPVDIPITSINIVKCFQKPSVNEWWQVELVLGGDYAQQLTMTGGVYAAAAIDIFIKQ